MKGRATGRYSILRGTATNEFADIVDSETPALTGVRAAVIEQNRRVYLPAEGATRVVRSYAGLIGAEVDIRKGDRLRDERTNVTYMVLEISEPVNVAHSPDYELVLSRTN